LEYIGIIGWNILEYIIDIYYWNILEYIGIQTAEVFKLVNVSDRFEFTQGYGWLWYDVLRQKYLR